MMTIAADQFVRVLIDAQRAGEYPANGEYYRVARQCHARPDGAGDGWVTVEHYNLDDAILYAEHLQTRADREGNIAQCAYIVRTLAGLEVYRTQMSTLEDQPARLA